MDWFTKCTCEFPVLVAARNHDDSKRMTMQLQQLQRKLWKLQTKHASTMTVNRWQNEQVAEKLQKTQTKHASTMTVNGWQNPKVAEKLRKLLLRRSRPQIVWTMWGWTHDVRKPDKERLTMPRARGRAYVRILNNPFGDMTIIWKFAALWLLTPWTPATSSRFRV